MDVVVPPKIDKLYGLKVSLSFSYHLRLILAKRKKFHYGKENFDCD
jgi:hypothetical protein